jgi:heme/copper-type cytochrome/quinol oxidase subunit 2
MLITITLFIVFGVIGWLATRIYKMRLEKRLGRKLQSEHELTSIASWMEASEDDKPHDQR